MKPQRPGAFPGERIAVAWGRDHELWTWTVRDPAAAPRFAVHAEQAPNYYRQQIVVGLLREDAAALAGLLLRSPACRNVHLEELAPEGEWVLPEPEYLGPAAPEDGDAEAVRPVPLAERKKALIEYLKGHGPQSRARILQETNIPPGSLSVLLTRGAAEEWLARSDKGLWGLVEGQSAQEEKQEEL